VESKSASSRTPSIRQMPEFTKTDYGIGIVGIGGVANWGHLPAYQKYGFKVVAGAAPRAETREAASRTWGIPKLYASYEQLLADPEVEVVDITVHHRAETQRRKLGGSDYLRLEIVKDAVAAGKKGILIQKPLADSVERAQAIVAAVKGSKTKLAVNQNGRFGPGHYIAKQLIEQGFVGEVESVAIENMFPLPMAGLYMAMTVHLYDTVRYWMGREPSRIYASLDPAKPLSATMAILDFAGGARASVLDLNGGRIGMGSPTSDQAETFRIEGTKGTIKGTHRWGLMMPPDSVEYFSELGENAWIKPVLSETYPEVGFRGTMGDLMQAIADDREPTCSGDDNLKTIAILFASVQSAKEGRAIEL
jgi:predicted dehydrogenase